MPRARLVGASFGRALLLFTVLCGTGPAGCAVSADDDYLEPDLRARVEALKRSVSAEPTSPGNVEQRAEVLWDWANAFALDGGMLPVYLPATINHVARARFDGEPPPERVLRDMDAFVRELRIKDERPEALGALHFVDPRPLVAASWTTVEQVYAVGSEPLRPGATFMMAQQMMADQGLFQHEDPAADNYVSIRASRAGLRWEKVRIPLGGMHGAFSREPTPTVAFRLAAGRLEPGDAVHVTHGDRSSGSRGWQVQTFSVDGVLLPIYVDLDGSGLFLSPRWPGLRVVGRPEVRSVRALAPSVVAPGEPFDLTVRSEDPYFNRPTGSIPAYEVLLDGEDWRRIPAGSDALTVLSDVRLREPGVHRFQLRSPDGKVEGASNPVWVREDPRSRLYWGETHGHCGFAEGQGTAESYYRFGRDDARLDFLTLSEHDALMDDWEWRRLQELTRAYHDEERLITFLGYEWSAQRRQGGHHNVLFRTPERSRVPVQSANDLSLLYAGLHAENDPEDVLVIPHAHNAGDWTRSDGALERLVEVTSLHGTFEWFGNLYLKSGFEVGFVGASDDHRANPGYGTPLRKPFLTQRPGIAGLWAPEKTTDAIFDALRGLSAYATTGERMILEAHLNGHPMGTRQDGTPRRRLTCRVAGTSPIDRIEVVKNGQVALSRSYLEAPLRSRSWIQIGFESSSEVFFPPRDNPRPFRAWEGSFEVEGARLLAVETPGFDNHYAERAVVDEDHPQRVRFYVETRGRMDTLLLLLEGASSSTLLHFRLEPNMERGSRAGNVRPPAMIPGAELTLPLAELRSSRLEHEFQVGRHTDRIRLQVVDPDAPMDRKLEFTDLEQTAAGDYYYVRVVQLDGGMAFSSPFWVGRESPEEALSEDR